MSRTIKYCDAVREAFDCCLAADPRVYIMGLGVPDPKGIFGTTLGLQERYGESRVMDMPCAENGMTGIAIGSALGGLRPILTHQRVDFAMLTMEQLANQAAKWYAMFGRQRSVPLVVRLLVGRGWGQGPQHSQSLQAWFAHIPGLKVVMPTTARDAKGLMIASIEDNNPVIVIEHRWLHSITGEVPEGRCVTPIGKAAVMREGSDVTLVGISYMSLECLRAADRLQQDGISAEVLDLRTVSPLDTKTILDSVNKTKNLVVADTGSTSFGVSAEIVARVCESGCCLMQSAPKRIALPDSPTPTSPALAKFYYPRSTQIANAVRLQKGLPPQRDDRLDEPSFLDVPDPTFTGPF